MKTIAEYIFIGLLFLTYPTQSTDILLPVSPPGEPANTERQQILEENSQKNADDADNSTSKSTTENSSPSTNSSDSTALQPDAETERIVGNTIVTDDGKEYPLVTYKPLLAPNDPNYNQWWVQNINMDEAWDTPVGSNQTLLAIIDTGYALAHEEFSGRWFANSGESGLVASENPSDLNCSDQTLPLTEACNNIDDDGDGISDNEPALTTTFENPSFLNCSDQFLTLDKSCNLIDDDGNGYVDDYRGWDFINHDRSVQAGEMNPDGSGTHHGSYVAGVAAATGNNNVGMAGADWNSQILPLQALDDNKFGHTLSVARSIRYAADMGADVISISLGATVNDSYLRAAVAYAIEAGSIIVAASGNDSCDCINYPANFPEVVAVGASTASNQRASFSNWGANLDVVAPGVSIYTTDWSVGDPTSDYATVSGTSLSTPIVAGLLSRMRSYQPEASAQQMIAALQEQNNKLTIPSSQSRDDTFGFGKIVADAAMQRVASVLNLEQKTGFDSVSYGSNYRPIGTNEFAYDCTPDGRQPTSPIYTLTKNTIRLFTTSEVERAELEDDGYSSSLLAYTCLTLPDDTVTTKRSINPHKEFFNSNYKD